MQHCSIPKELTVCGNNKTKKQKTRCVTPFEKKSKANNSYVELI